MSTCEDINDNLIGRILPNSFTKIVWDDCFREVPQMRNQWDILSFNPTWIKVSSGVVAS